MLLKFPLGNDFDQGICLVPRDVAALGDVQNTKRCLTFAPTKDDFVVGFDDMGRFCGTAIEQNKTRVAELLSNRTARAKAADFEKKIEAHRGAKRKEHEPQLISA